MKPKYIEPETYLFQFDIEDEDGNLIKVNTEVEVEERVYHDQDEDGWYTFKSATVNTIRIPDDIPEALIESIEWAVKDEMKKMYVEVDYEYAISKTL